MKFLLRWFALKRLEADIRRMEKSVAKQLADMDRTLAAMRDMRCPNCGVKRCSDE